MPCLGSASQLKGEQNFHIPCVGTGERAACCTICPSIVILTPDTLARGNPPDHRERALPPSGAPQTVVAPNARNRLTRMKKACREQGECHQYWATHLPSLKMSTPLDFTEVVENADTEGPKPSRIGAHERGGGVAGRGRCTGPGRGNRRRRTRWRG